MIARRRIFEKEEPSRKAQKIYIFCEGAVNEPNYFSFFVNISSNLELLLFPPEDHKSDPVKLLERASSLFIDEGHPIMLEPNENDLVWFVVDTDTWAEDGKIALLRSFCDKQNENHNYSIWNIAQSNPSLEIWLYYHIYREVPKDSEVKSKESFKAYVNWKISGGFNYLIMPALIKTAIYNSSFNYRTDINGPLLYSTDLFKLGNVILQFAGKEIDRKTRRL
jgi:hypothetical protein